MAAARRRTRARTRTPGASPLGEVREGDQIKFAPGPEQTVYTVVRASTPHTVTGYRVQGRGRNLKVKRRMITVLLRDSGGALHEHTSPITDTVWRA